MTIEDFKAFIESIKYKPGFNLSLKGDYFEADKYETVRPNPEMKLDGVQILTSQPFHLYFSMQVLDADSSSYNPSLFPLVKKVYVYKAEIESLSQAAWESIIFNHIRDMEFHEAGEFFRVGNRKPFNPHLKRDS